MKTQRNDVGQKIAKRTHSGHIAKIVMAAKESAIATAIAVDDYRKTLEIETLVMAAKECHKQIKTVLAQLTAEHDRTLAYRDELNDIAYQDVMRRIPEEITPKVQEAETRLRAVNDKLMRAGLEITAERWDLLADGVNHRVRGCDHRLELIEVALGSAKPKKAPKRRADGKFASAQS